jgi:hypothetical protein
VFRNCTDVIMSACQGDSRQVEEAFPDFNAITFIKEHDADPRLVQAAHGRLGGMTGIVDVSYRDATAGKLGDLLHLG